MPAAHAFDPLFELSDLNGSNGFALNGGASSNSGVAVGAGDVNGDGVADLLIGAYNAGSNGVNQTGQAYVVYGEAADPPAPVPAPATAALLTPAFGRLAWRRRRRT